MYLMINFENNTKNNTNNNKIYIYIESNAIYWYLEKIK